MHSEAQRRKLTKLIIRDLKESVKHPHVSWNNRTASITGNVQGSYVLLLLTRNSKGLWRLGKVERESLDSKPLWEGRQLKEAGSYIQTLMLLTRS